MKIHAGGRKTVGAPTLVTANVNTIHHGKRGTHGKSRNAENFSVFCVFRG